MSVPIDKENIAPLKFFVDLCTKNPQILHLPDLKFVKDFIESFGGRVPPVPETESASTKDEKSKQQDNIDADDDESVIDLDMTGVIEPDNDPPQKMGDLSLKPTEEDISQAQAKRSEALSAYAENDYEKAIALYTEAILLNPHAALLYAKRGQVYLCVKKPNACIRDCNVAIELNPDNAAAHKFRGRAKQLLGNWEEAAIDLRLACQLDFDEQADEWLREVTPNAKKIEEHKRKKEREDLEKAQTAKRDANKKARETNGGSPPDASGGFKPSMGDFYQYLSDPEVQAAFRDPELSQAFVDISSNPANIMKYQNNPKVMDLISKVAGKFGGMRGFPGMGGMGGMGGMPGGLFSGGAGATPQPSAPRPEDDVGLD